MMGTEVEHILLIIRKVVSWMVAVNVCGRSRRRSAQTTKLLCLLALWPPGSKEKRWLDVYVCTVVQCLLSSDDALFYEVSALRRARMEAREQKRMNSNAHKE